MDLNLNIFELYKLQVSVLHIDVSYKPAVIELRAALKLHNTISSVARTIDPPVKPCSMLHRVGLPRCTIRSLKRVGSPWQRLFYLLKQQPLDRSSFFRDATHYISHHFNILPFCSLLLFLSFVHIIISTTVTDRRSYQLADASFYEL